MSDRLSSYAGVTRVPFTEFYTWCADNSIATSEYIQISIVAPRFLIPEANAAGHAMSHIGTSFALSRGRCARRIAYCWSCAKTETKWLL